MAQDSTWCTNRCCQWGISPSLFTIPFSFLAPSRTIHRREHVRSTDTTLRTCLLSHCLKVWWIVCCIGKPTSLTRCNMMQQTSCQTENAKSGSESRRQKCTCMSKREVAILNAASSRVDACPVYAGGGKVPIDFAGPLHLATAI